MTFLAILFIMTQDSGSPRRLDESLVSYIESDDMKSDILRLAYTPILLFALISDDTRSANHGERRKGYREILLDYEQNLSIIYQRTT
jgi:hypothetical protein